MKAFVNWLDSLKLVEMGVLWSLGTVDWERRSRHTKGK